ncbi:MAG: chemotaxis protein CheW [Deltaproteobacteria bacterium]|nr:chemotaxis protein CheW [Deltaproteobacteria bacterium]
MDVLVVAVGDVRCGLDAARIDAVVRAVAITPLPVSPSGVRGIVDVRGDVVPVVDLRLRFGLEPLLDDMHAQIVLLRMHGGQRIAVQVDRALDLVSLDASEVQPVGVAARASDLVRGACATREGLLLVHDIDAFLASGEREELEHVLREHREPAA